MKSPRRCTTPLEFRRAQSAYSATKQYRGSKVPLSGWLGWRHFNTIQSLAASPEAWRRRLPPSPWMARPRLAQHLRSSQASGLRRNRHPPSRPFAVQARLVVYHRPQERHRHQMGPWVTFNWRHQIGANLVARGCSLEHLQLAHIARHR